MSIDFIKSLYFEFLSYFVPQKIEYQIVGECKKCAKCCTQVRSYGMKNEKELKFMSLFFPYYRNFYITGKDEKGNLILCCKYITEDSLCAIYDKRPNICRNYPVKKIFENKQMIEGCGYKVIKKEFKDYL